MWNVTSSMADFLFCVSNGILILGAALVLCGTIGSIIIGGVREQFSNERISENEKETSRANESAAKANERATKAELELEQYRVGRSLLEKQRAVLLERLRRSPKGPVIIKPNFLSAEPIRYADELSKVFNNAGFADVGDKPLSIISTKLQGMFVVVRDKENLPPQFSPIADALKEANIPFSAHEEGYVPDTNTVVILVGERP